MFGRLFKTLGRKGGDNSSELSDDVFVNEADFSLEESHFDEQDDWAQMVEAESSEESATQQIFLAEANDLMSQLQAILDRWKAKPKMEQLQEEFQKRLHTLKGSAGLAGFIQLAKHVQTLESYIEESVQEQVVGDRAFFIGIDRRVTILVAILEEKNRKFNYVVGKNHLPIKETAKSAPSSSLLKSLAQEQLDQQAINTDKPVNSLLVESADETVQAESRDGVNIDAVVNPESNQSEQGSQGSADLSNSSLLMEMPEDPEEKERRVKQQKNKTKKVDAEIELTLEDSAPVATSINKAETQTQQTEEESVAVSADATPVAQEKLDISEYFEKATDNIFKKIKAVNEIALISKKDSEVVEAHADKLHNFADYQNRKIKSVYESKKFFFEEIKNLQMLVAPYIASKARTTLNDADRRLLKSAIERVQFWQKVDAIELCDIDASIMHNRLLVKQDALGEVEEFTFAEAISGLEADMHALCESLGKNIDLEILGTHLEIPEDLFGHVRLLVDALLRHVVGHRVETFSERIERHKDKVSTVRVGIIKSNERLKLFVENEGVGVDVRSAQRQLAEAGLMVADNLKHRRLVPLMFSNNMHTLESSANLKNYDVHLDVVIDEVESLGGSLLVYSQQNQGSRFIIDIPFSKTDLAVLLVRHQDFQFAIPAYQLRDKLSGDECSLEVHSHIPYVVHGENTYRLYALEHLLIQDLHKARLSSKEAAEACFEKQLLLMSFQGKEIVLAVDEAIDLIEVKAKYLMEADGLPDIVYAYFTHRENVLPILSVERVMGEWYSGVAQVQIGLSPDVDIENAYESEKHYLAEKRKADELAKLEAENKIKEERIAVEEKQRREQAAIEEKRRQIEAQAEERRRKAQIEAEEIKRKAQAEAEERKRKALAEEEEKKRQAKLKAEEQKRLEEERKRQEEELKRWQEDVRRAEEKRWLEKDGASKKERTLIKEEYAQVGEQIKNAAELARLEAERLRKEQLSAEEEKRLLQEQQKQAQRLAELQEEEVLAEEQERLDVEYADMASVMVHLEEEWQQLEEQEALQAAEEEEASRERTFKISLIEEAEQEQTHVPVAAAHGVVQFMPSAKNTVDGEDANDEQQQALSISPEPMQETVVEPVTLQTVSIVQPDASQLVVAKAKDNVALVLVDMPDDEREEIVISETEAFEFSCKSFFGDELLDAIEENKYLPDVVLLSSSEDRPVNMDVLTNIRHSPELQTVPVVILTSSDSDIFRQRAFLLGANYVLEKPYSVEDLHEVIATVATQINVVDSAHS